MSIIDRFVAATDGAKPRIVVVGDVMVDKYVTCDVTGTLPECETALKLKPVSERLCWGGAANVGANLQVMGAAVRVIGAAGILSGDPEDRSTPSRFRERPWTVKTRYVTRKGHVLFRVDTESAEPISDKVADGLLKDVLVLDPALIVVSDYAKGVVTTYLMRRLVSLGVKVIVGPKGSNPGKYDGAWCIVPNEAEAAQLDSSEDSGMGSGERSVVTRGADGCELLLASDSEGSRVFFPVRRREVGDPCGCGDSFLAAFSLAVISDLSLPDACRIGNAAGACAFDHAGTHVVSRVEILDELKWPEYEGAE